jgi:hypothetical protein
MTAMPDHKYRKFSIIATVERDPDDEPVTEAKMLSLLRQLVRGWQHGHVTVHDVVEKDKPERRPHV